MPTATITDNRAESRFEIDVDGRPAILAYRRERKRLVLTHTEVPEEAEGQGLGGKLVRAAFEAAREAGEKVVPLCPFANTWVKRHPEFEPLVERHW